MTNADLMEEMLDLEGLPPESEEIGLFMKFLDIIRELDAEMKKLEKQEKDHKVKVEYRLRPSSSSKTGFEEGLTFVAT
jgi:hypothetical protein